jgi:cytochrome P450
MNSTAHVGSAQAGPVEIKTDMRALKRMQDVPGPRGFGLVGNMLQINAMQFHVTVEKWAREFGPVYKFSIGRDQFLVVTDSSLITSLSRDRPDALQRNARLSDRLVELGVSGVFTSEGDDWRKQRKLVMRALTPEVIRRFFPTMTMMTERLRQRWIAAVGEGRDIDLLRDLKAFTLDVAIGLAMGQDVNALEHDSDLLQRDIEQIFKRVGKRLLIPFAYWRRFPLASDRAATACAQRIERKMTGFIADARREMKAHPQLREHPENMLQALIAARDEHASEFTDAHVIGNAITMVFAGEDTTSNSIGWLLDFVSRMPPVAVKLANEADAMLGKSRVLSDIAALDHLPYLDATNNETMRLKPVAPLLGFQNVADMEIAGVLVPANTQILACSRLASEWSNEFPNYTEFVPERWLGSEEMAGGDDLKRKIFPFGGGPRFCPGRFLALAEIKMVMTMVARNFVLSRIDNAPPVKEAYTFTMGPNRLPIRMELRK